MRAWKPISIDWNAAERSLTVSRGGIPPDRRGDAKRRDLEFRVAELGGGREIAPDTWRLDDVDDATVAKACEIAGLHPGNVTPDLREILIRTWQLELPPRADEATRAAIRSSWRSAKRPYRHQLDGVYQLSERRSWLLAWAMGTAKSATVAVRLDRGRRAGEFRGPILIVCPLLVIDVWVRELREFAAIDARVARGGIAKVRDVLDGLKAGDVVVTNYETVRQERVKHKRRVPGDKQMAFLNADFDVVVLDEAHRIRDPKTAQHKACRRLGNRSRYRWALTGTPAPNSPLEIFGILLFLNARLAGTESIVAWRNRYAIPNPKDPHIIEGYKNLPDLQQRVSKISSVVRKEDALDLPPMSFSDRLCDLSKTVRGIYDDVRRDSVALLRSRKGAGTLTVQNALVEIMRLAQITGGFVPDDDGTLHELKPNAKLDLLKRTLADLHEDLPDEKLVIWAHFRAEIDAIMSLLGDAAGVIHGGVPNERRREIIDEYMHGELQYIVATPAAASEGITLTAGSYAVYFSRSYSSLVYWQSRDRIHRIGQNRPVTIIHLQARNTVDQKIAAAIESKESLQSMILTTDPGDYL